MGELRTIGTSADLLSTIIKDAHAASTMEKIAGQTDVHELEEYTTFPSNTDEWPFRRANPPITKLGKYASEMT